MIYLDNIIFFLQKNGGISKYWHYLIKGLENKNIEHQFLSQNKLSNNIFHKNYYSKNIVNNHFPLSIDRYLPIFINDKKKFIFHSSYYRVSMSKNSINVVTVHDFIYEKFRKGVSKYVHSTQKNFALNNSSAIICNSNNTKKDLLNFLPKIPKEKIHTIPMGADQNIFKELEEPLYLKKFNNIQNLDFFIFIGDPSIAYKNFTLVNQILSNFEDKKIVIITNKNLTEIQSVIDKENISKVIMYKNLSDEEINYLFNKAFCLFYFSLYEGFGMPIIESMMAGCPVISLNNSSISELIKNYEIKIPQNSNTVNEILNIINKLQDCQYREKVKFSGRKIAKIYNWDICISKTINIYRSLI